MPSVVTIEQAHATFLTIAASNQTGPFEVFASHVHRSYEFLIVGGIRLVIPPWFAPGRAAPRPGEPLHAGTTPIIDPWVTLPHPQETDTRVIEQPTQDAISRGRDSRRLSA